MTDQYFHCPCCSGKPYQQCCGVYHQGQKAESASLLMRSRYSAYALNNVEYIVKTTHPRCVAVTQHIEKWKEEILHFSMHTDFEKLEILDFKEQTDRAIVVFVAHLKQNDQDISFTERSFFSKIDGCWFYVNGDVFSGKHSEVKASF